MAPQKHTTTPANGDAHPGAFAPVDVILEAVSLVLK